ncbi:sensor domain-containing diguanylate cyclase [Chromohalobacter japonicus]|uniref:sensor domain-containing diguanylate cyclase n=1 Tax=Chromohalobacter japonicus TaxID=223900 RepID=UPI000B147450|nr:diguanylate cyclase [Chromohalobacter japonicus]
MMRLKTLGARLVIATIVPLLLVTAMLYPIFRTHLETRLDSSRHGATTLLNAEYDALLHGMNESFNQVLAVAELPILQRHLHNVREGALEDREDTLEQLAAMLETLATHFGRYTRLVLLDTSGEELLEAGSRLLPYPTGTRYAQSGFFRGTERLPPRGLYVSAPRLGESRRDGKTVTTAVIDIATPVFDQQGQRLGMLLFTLDWHYLTASLPHAIDSGEGARAVMVDGQGKWLLPDTEEGMRFGDSLAERYPQVWHELATRAQGEILLDDDLLRFRTQDIRAAAESNKAGMIVTPPAAQPWRLGIVVPRPGLSGLLAENPWQIAVLGLIYLLAVVVGMLWVLSLHRQRYLRRQAMEFSREAQRLARESQQYAGEVQDLYENAPCGYHSLDHDGRIVKINRTELEWLGYRADEVIDTCHYRDFVTPDTRAAFDDAFRDVLSAGQEGAAECVLMCRDGTRLPVIIQASAHVIEERFQYSRATVFDLSERKKLEARLAEQAMADPLTGLWNRRYLKGQAAKEMARARRGGSPLSLIVIDLDHFKRINDTHGHDVGDLVLQSFADTARIQLREGDILCRMGGEEFVILLPDTAPEQAMQVAERLRLAVSTTSVEIGGEVVATGCLTYTASLGVARVDPEEASLEPAIKRADEALYAAKNAGRNRVH